jgi:aspartyl-tRNA(Asn)/glutamyl-tRNA(Gln) amidotransferase subunit C
MKISTEEVAKIAALARLRLSEDKAGLFAAQMGDILGYMDLLGQCDTTGVAPLYGPVSHAAPLRPDEVRQVYSRDEVLGNAPEDDGQFFIVPKIV